MCAQSAIRAESADRRVHHQSPYRPTASGRRRQFRPAFKVAVIACRMSRARALLTSRTGIFRPPVIDLTPGTAPDRSRRHCVVWFRWFPSSNHGAVRVWHFQMRSAIAASYSYASSTSTISSVVSSSSVLAFSSLVALRSAPPPWASESPLLPEHYLSSGIAQRRGIFRSQSSAQDSTQHVARAGSK